jgi:hypothetical protein
MRIGWSSQSPANTRLTKPTRHTHWKNAKRQRGISSVPTTITWLVIWETLQKEMKAS